MTTGARARPALRWLRSGMVRALLMLAVPYGCALAADPERGRAVYEACAACHGERPDASGPSLRGVIGRPAATAPEFRYSAPMKRARIVWTEENLRAYLTDPQRTVPGNRMPYAGIRDASDLDDLMSYLATLR